MEVVKISKVQAMMLGVSSIIVTGHLLYIPIIIFHSGRDSWLSLLITIIPAILIGLTVALLSLRYPGCSMVEYTQIILGKWLGRLVVIMFLFYFMHEASLSIRGFGEFYTSAITPRTPIVVYFIAILILAGYAIRCGLEVLARTNQAILLFLIPIGIMASILTHKDKDYQNFLPILEDGIVTVFPGVLSLVSLYSSFFVLSMVFQNLSNTKQLKKYSLLTMLILVVMFIGPITGVIAIYGEERATGLYFPTFQILRDIEIGTFQRIDILGILLWSLGNFSKVALFLYAIVLGFAQLFKLDDFKILVVPVGALLTIISILNSEDFIGIYRFLRDFYPYYGTFVGLILPLGLLMVSFIRGKKERSKGAN